MKKLFLSVVLLGISFSSFSCRETTQEKTEDAVEAIGEDIEDGTRKAADEIERGAENLEREIDEEIHETDDQIQEETVLENEGRRNFSLTKIINPEAIQFFWAYSVISS